jgi:hypothetical protein
MIGIDPCQWFLTFGRSFEGSGSCVVAVHVPLPCLTCSGNSTRILLRTVGITFLIWVKIKKMGVHIKKTILSDGRQFHIISRIRLLASFENVEAGHVFECGGH